MNLGELKQAFARLQDRVFIFKKGFHNPHPYFYDKDDIGFNLILDISLEEVKQAIDTALGQVFESAYFYDESTRANLVFGSPDCDTDYDSFEYLVTEMLNEYSDAHQTVPTKKKRKTAAEKRQEQQAAQDAANAAEWELFKKEYPVKFAALMWDYFKFSQSNYKISVNRDGDTYSFNVIDGWYTEHFKLNAVPPEQYSWEYLQTFRDAEQAIETEREKQREVERKELLKQTALAKLSDEERKVLGL